MIRPLRQRHRRIVIVLGIFLPVAFVLGVAARKPVPIVAELPAALAGTAQTFGTLKWERGDLFTKSPVQVRLWREQKDTGWSAIALSGAKDFAKPDLLVYWITGNPKITDTLPDTAILLGSFNTTVLPIPDEVSKLGGVLVLYSVANGEVVNVSKPVRFDGSTQ